MRKRILFVIGQLGLGGGEKQLYLLLRGLNKAVYEPLVITFNDKPGDFWENEILALNIVVLRVNRYSNGLRRTIDFWKKISMAKPDLIVSWSLYLNFICAILARILLRKPSISSIRCDLFNETTPKIKIYRFLGTKLATTYVVNSSAGRNDLINRLGVRPEKIKIIYNAVFVDAEEGHERSVRQMLCLPEDKFLILNVGRLEAGKNQIMLLRVLELLKARGIHNVGVAFIGGGEELENLKMYTLTHGLSGDVFFLGKLPNAIKFFNAFDLLCHTSIGEGMPNVIVEAAVVGLPIVATAVNGISDLVENGESGFIIGQNDDHTMCERVMSLLSDANLRTAMAKNARTRILSHVFSIEKMVADFQILFDTSIHKY